MKHNLIFTVFIMATLILPIVNAQDKSMSFFVTSENMGKGGNLGGLAGADQHCQKLATVAGAGNRKWRAYLSSERVKGKRGVSARDRIGKGPWFNSKGVLIAENTTELHLFNKTIIKQTALDENGDLVNGRGDKPNQHDMLTGTRDDGTAYFPDDADHTCNNWTSSDTGSAQLGHHDRHGGGNTSWNSAHASRGCSISALKKTGGDARFYCFASD
ncbi:MAG: DUF1554 domain-containing protein [Gammaproteobacteria bacterium]|nr:DUF1554 domain-containing protein [Gammaproteobacteria bacterium]MBT3722905.1 DUF1554 domain-containing protein [Gammaproteobacteria bacterium]MBT4077612.1 DUF1554 domain-containing protein [Gammaproteobacteria bacterium]MBT4194423.1 DUF1554 domain-containing protein [Gammaproteobacteria bacterium]MBT4450445.1 DUF1554 domain-containing protein [Gammaproteobacteria bacterium]